MSEKDRVRESYLRQVRRQVVLPLVLGVIVVAGLAVLAGTAHVAAVGTWADVALVVLLIPVMVAGIVLLGVTVGAAYLVGRLIPQIPEPAARVRLHWHRYSRMVVQGAERIAGPVVQGGALAGGAESVVRQMRSLVKLILGGRDGN